MLADTAAAAPTAAAGQVLEESLRVLAEVESLICDSLQLPFGSGLHGQAEELLSQVPGPLLDALEVGEGQSQTGLRQAVDTGI